MIPNKYNQKIEKKITYISIYGTIYRKMHPSGVTVEIVGISMNDRGRSCEEHDVCGSVLTEDSIVRFRKTQVIIEGREQSAIAGYWVSDGIDRCRIGFLPKHLVKQRRFRSLNNNNYRYMYRKKGKQQHRTRKKTMMKLKTSRM